MAALLLGPKTRALLPNVTLLLAVAVLAACTEKGSGDLVTVTLEGVSPDRTVKSIEVNDDFDIKITVDPAATQEASVTIDDNLVNDLAAFVNNDGQLTVEFSGTRGRDPSQTPVITLTVKELEGVNNNGDGNITATGVEADEFEIEHNGEGTVEVNGTANRVIIDVDAGGDVRLAELIAGEVELEHTGGGEMEVHATESISGEISGDGDVIVFGEPAEQDVEEKAAGTLIVR